MPGVRIAPAPDRTVPDNAIIALRDLSRPLGDPAVLDKVKEPCATCVTKHFHKTYHFQLRDGSVIVSETIWAKLQVMPDSGGFTLVNYVEEPPAQGLTPGEPVSLIEKYPLNEVAPTKQRSRVASLFRPKSKTALAGEGK